MVEVEEGAEGGGVQQLQYRGMAAPAGGGASGSQVAVGSAGVSVSLSELNPHFVCVLCFGYFVDATTITECMHTFCKSCIVNFLRTKRHCPHCDTLLTKTRPYNSLRPDRVMQALVFKTVPGLFQVEMKRRIEFYQSHPHADYEQDVEDFQHYVFSPDDSVSLSIRYYNFSDDASKKQEQEPQQQQQQQQDNKQQKEENAADTGSVVRYFRCPATVPVAVLKTLVKTKYRVPDPFRVELLYGDDRLLDSWTLMEVAYIYKWKRESPMELSFQVVATRKVRKRRQVSATPSVSGDKEEIPVLSNSTAPPPEEPPEKVARIEAPCPDTANVMLTEGQTSMDTSPPTPPETPEGGQDRESEQFPVEGQTVTDPQGDENENTTDGEAPTLQQQPEAEHTMEEEAPELQAEVPLTVQENGLPEENTQQCKEEVNGEDAEKHNMEASEDFDTSKESNDLIVDHDSETPLEVDTSHETEPDGEGEGDGDGDGEQDGDSNRGGGKDNDNSGNHAVDGETNGKHCRDDEQEDSAIDVTETSASEPMDSDDKDTDLNVSTESNELEVEEHSEGGTTTREVQTDEGPLNLSQGCRGDKNFRKDCYVFTDNEDDEEDCGDQEEEHDEVGALDLSRHARSVREARTQRESLESPPGDGSGKGENRNARGQGTQTILSITQSKKSKKLKQPSASSTGAATPSVQTASIVAPITRPPMPLDWACSSLVPTPVNPQAVAFNDLMTLSHAAVQLQLMAHHAQAQAQAQAQARAQAAEVHARAQAEVLKSLKSTESLSFVNGSGDTLTISPITATSPDIKSKTTYSKAVTKSHHTPKTVNGNTYSKNMNNKSHNTSKSGGSISSSRVSSAAINHGSIRTTISKSGLAASLKIPNVSVGSKTNGTPSLSTTKAGEGSPGEDW
ncbi:hypothetical protein O3P69_001454 [Scylla paramamosain]|uniref:RING-type domain-containing protein n=1 Tax=Scylla paramamosain TaxID=85552 RepID=A0AAW0UXV7_SCYPA